MTQQQGKLFLLPSPITEQGLEGISSQVIEIIHGLDHFIVERGRTARRYLRAVGYPGPIDNVQIIEMDDQLTHQVKSTHLDPLAKGVSIGILSEAGLPGIADPGQWYVAEAHKRNFEVVPVSGPSSLFMALMASGLDGQRFAFHGYLPAKKEELLPALRDLEIRASRDNATQLFIETPYRNHQIMAAAEKVLSPDRTLCIAASLGAADGFVRTRSVREWKKQGWPAIHKMPAVFLIR